MKIFLITSIALIATFLFDLFFRKTVEKRPFIVGHRYKIHHSVAGMLLFGAGLSAGNDWILSLGLGMYLAHGFEEMYFNHTRFPEAFFVFVTRAKRAKRR